MSKLFGKLYSGLPVEQVDVTDYISTPDKTKKGSALERESEMFNDDESRFDPDIQKRIEARQNWIFQEKGPQPPVTEQEAEEITRQVESAKAEMESALSEVELMQSVIQEQIDDADAAGSDVAITLDTSKKSALRRAMRKLFGGAKARVTLADYKALLQARSEMEEAAALDYARGFPEEG